jgi:hypothetical protein
MCTVTAMPQAAAKDVSARTLLAQLKVRDARETGYDRDKFGQWIDADRDGCDTRREVLISEAKTKPKVGRGCDLAGGSWVSPYDGKGYRDPTKLQIDHMVPLSEAWKSGAYRWTNTTRQRFANDLGYGPSLVAVTSRLNMSKGDREPWQWLPPKKSYQCKYVANWIAVKWRWGMTVDSWEKSTLGGLLNYCGAKATTTMPRKATVRLR